MVPMSNAYSHSRSGCAPTRYRGVVLTVLRRKVLTVRSRVVLTVLRRKVLTVRSRELVLTVRRCKVLTVRSRELVLTVSLFFALAFVSSCQLARRASVTTASPTPTPSPILGSPRLPYPKRFVNDYAKVFDDKTSVRLETLLTKLRDKSNIEFAIATVDTTNGESI